MTDHDSRNLDGKREEARFDAEEVTVFFEANINIDDHKDDCYSLQCEFIDRWLGNSPLTQLTPESAMFLKQGHKELIEALPLIVPFMEEHLMSIAHTNLIVYFSLDGGYGEEVIQCDDDPLKFKFKPNPEDDFAYYHFNDLGDWNGEEYPDHEVSF